MFGTKGGQGLFFEDFAVGQWWELPIPRTLTDGDRALYTALTGDRTPAYCGPSLVHPLAVFHTVFGQTVRVISLNAVANLGYARMKWGAPVEVGDTLTTRIDIVGLKENSSGASGIVWVDTVGRNQHGVEVIRFTRWVMVRKRSEAPTAYRNTPVIPDLPAWLTANELELPSTPLPTIAQTGSPLRWSDYTVGERIAHWDGMTVTEAEHMSFTRLFQNSAKVHFDARAMQGRPLVYGGVVISLAYALSFNGLENRVGIRAINGGTHANPVYAGDTLYAYTEVLDAAKLGGGVGALRLRMVVVKNREPWAGPFLEPQIADPRNPARSAHRSDVVLDLDYWDLVPT
jgi:2-methylfumaryl-CoA hydratase